MLQANFYLWSELKHALCIRGGLVLKLGRIARRMFVDLHGNDVVMMVDRPVRWLFSSLQPASR